MTFRLRLALRYLGERRLRTGLTTLSIVVGVMLIFGLNGMIPALEESLRQSAMTTGHQADLTVTSEARGAFDEALVAEAGRVPGVAQVTGSLVRPVAIPPEMAPQVEGGATLSVLNLSGLDFENAPAAQELVVVSGRTLSTTDTLAMLISGPLAEQTSLTTGDTLSLPAASGVAEFAIVGLVNDPARQAGLEAYVRLVDAQSLLNLPGQINSMDILFADNADPQATTQAILDRLGPGFKSGALEAGSQFTASLDVAGPVFTLFGILVLAMAGFIIFNTFRTVVAERQHDIGLLRAVGASRRDILGLVMIESLLQGFAGTILGLAAGYLFVQGLLAAMGQLWTQRVSFPLGNARFSWQNLLLAILLGVGITLISGLIPAISASRVTPIEALRPSMAEVTSQVDDKFRTQRRRRIAWSAGLIVLALGGLISGELALAALGLVFILSAVVILSPILIQPLTAFFGRLLLALYAREGYLAKENLVRRPDRAAVTVSAMMIGLAILLALTGLVTAVTTDVVGFIDQSLGGDFLLMPQSQVLSGGNVGAGPELAAALQQTPGIDRVTSLRAASAQANDQDVQVIGLDPVSYPDVAALNITSGDPGLIYRQLAQGRTLIANTIYAARNQVEIGDSLTLTTPEGQLNYEVVGIGTDYLNAQAAAIFLSQANLEQDFNETADLLLMADISEGADPAEVQRHLESVVSAYPALRLFGPGEFRDQIMSQGYGRLAIFYVMLAFVAVPSLIALANTLGINVIERTREIGMLRAVGASRRQLRRLITAESLLLSAVGIALGILVGLWLGYLLIGGLNAFGYPVSYSFPWSGVFLSAVIGLTMGLLAALLPARQAARMNIVKALQYE